MKNIVLAVLAVAVVVLGVLYARRERAVGQGGGGGAGRPRPEENNLTRVRCNSHNPHNPSDEVEILVNSTVGLDDKDKITFVCKNEKVHWKAAPGVRFTVTFTTWPFLNTQKSLDPDPTTGLTENQWVKPINTKYEIHEYTLVVTKSDGTKVTADPHMIPM
jgi:hypothetical protein